MELCESIDVGAVFSRGGMRPAWFEWRERRYDVKDITYTWESKVGMARLRHFSVVSGGNVYALAFNPVELSWEIRGAEQDWRG